MRAFHWAQLMCCCFCNGYLASVHRSGDFAFNLSGPPPIPSDVCLFRWESGIKFISTYRDVKGNLARHGGLHPAGRLKGRTVLVVHVGKTAGSSLLKLLRDTRIPHSDVHLFSLRTEAISLYDAIIVTVRDPVERTISAFNWDNPWARSGRAGRKKNFSSFYSTFADINEYAGNLTADTAAGEAARRAEGHIALDTCYYVGGVMDSLKRHGSTFVVDTATFREDIEEISRRLGWGINFSDSYIPEVNKLQKDVGKVTLTEQNYRKLKGFLQMIGEYYIYRALRMLFQLPKTISGHSKDEYLT